MTIRTAVRKAAVATLLAAAATVGLGTAQAQAEPFHTSYLTKSWAPWTSPWSQGPQYWTVPGNASVSMQCWTTGATREGTAKWFRIRSNNYPIVEGYVPANVVGNQWWTSPPC